MSCKETLFGIVPDEWTVSTIGEVTELKQGLQISKKLRSEENGEGYIPLLKITDLPSKVFSEYVKDIPEGYIASENDIIYTRTGQVGLVYTGVSGCVHNNCFKVIPNEDVLDREYLYYYLKSNRMFKNSNNIASGSVQKDLTHKAFKTVKIGFPSLIEQKRIGKILSSLDKKIELNNEMNKTLEEMAQALFKRWFVDFEFPNEDGKPYKSSGGEMVESELGMIPKGWRIDNLKDISIVTMGVSPSSNSYNENKVGLPLLNGAADFEGKLIKPSKYTSEPKKVCKCGDMIFGVRATIGNTVFADKEYALGRGVASVSPTSDISREFIYFSLNSSMNKLISSASGSVFLNLKKADITDLKLCYSQVALNKFNEITKKLINKIIENDIESEILKQQRDSLLPKLMSGEIRVDNMKANL